MSAPSAAPVWAFNIDDLKQGLARETRSRDHDANILRRPGDALGGAHRTPSQWARCTAIPRNSGASSWKVNACASRTVRRWRCGPGISGTRPAASPTVSGLATSAPRCLMCSARHATNIARPARVSASSPDFSNPLMHRGGESRKMAIRQSLTAIPERPRCKQSVAQHCSNLNRLNGTRLWPGSMAESSHRMPEGCCWGGWIAASG